jgi:hypothetical protein
MDLLNPINNTTQPMPESQGSPQNTKEASPKRDNKKLKVGGILNSVWCLWIYLIATVIKRWKDAFIKLTELLEKLLTFFLVFTFFSVIIIFVFIEFPKLLKIVTTLFPIFKIAFFTYVLLFVYIIIILLFIIPIFGLRGLVRALPALINELRGKLPKNVVEDSRKYLQDYPCMIKHFSNNAVEALSRISRSTFFLMLGVSFPIEIAIIILRLLSNMASLSAIEEMVTETVVEIALWVLSTVLAIIISLFLFSSQARFDVNTLRFVYDVKFTVLEWFIVAMILIIISMMMRPFIAVFIMVPIIIALIISINVYIILASATIDYMQLP